jgi:hypothetical protein
MGILLEIAVSVMSVIIYHCEQYHTLEDLNHQLVVWYTLHAIISPLQKNSEAYVVIQELKQY